MKNHSKVLSAILAGSLAMGAVGAGVSTAMAGTESHSGYQSTTLPVLAITSNRVVLVDGSVYLVPYNFDLSQLHVGDKVAVSWTSVKGETYRKAWSINPL